MKKYLLSLLLSVLLFNCVAQIGAADFSEGRIKLVLNETTGRFSLYYLTDIKKERYQALFVDKDPRTSFLSILVDDKAYRLGESTMFRLRVQNELSKPALVFESSMLDVIQEFEFIRTGGSTLANGIKMNIKVTNKAEKTIPVGIRFVLDTSLGENSTNHFYTDLQNIPSEILLTAKDNDAFWISKNESLGLMGSIIYSGITRPDMVHFANWKRLNDASWKVNPSNGRNFNLLPYSIGDSAVAYYYELVLIPRGTSRTVSIMFALASEKGFDNVGKSVEGDISQLLGSTPSDSSVDELSLRTDLIMVGDVMNRIDSILTEQRMVTEDDLAALESIISKLKAKNESR
ncbi:hypothetical protein [Gracilinema caldarium]|uniref:hypothetical protein n=1 Tax=Gracilinema caldarium TaxID=215591 RepID=UPI0026EE8097|nr:hypothetical protein [Gracilinema caldarium]